MPFANHPCDSKYVGWRLARDAYANPGVIIEIGEAQASFDPATHVFVLKVAGHPDVVVTATGPRSSRVVGSPLPTRYDSFYYLVEGFTSLAFDRSAPSQAFTES